MSNANEEEIRIPIVEEQAHIDKRARESARVRISTAVDERIEWVRQNLSSEEISIERRAIGREVPAPPEIRHEGDDLVIPVVEEILVVEKRWLLREELHVRKLRRTQEVEQPVTLRSTRVDVQRTTNDGTEQQQYGSRRTTGNTQESNMATRTITALFDSSAAANRARERLMQLGVTNDAIQLIQQDSDTNAQDVSQRKHGHGLWASIKHMFAPDEDRALYEEGIRRGGYLLTVRTTDAEVDRVCEVLDQSEAIDLSAREQQWRSEGWQGASAAASTTDREQKVPVVEEKLLVGKREVDRGGVRVRAYAVPEPVTEQVRLREEHVEIERRPVNQAVPGQGAAAVAAADDLLQERTIEMRERAEEAIVGKQARVKEELVVRKRADERVEQVSDSVRHTEVDIDQDGDLGERLGADKARLRRDEQIARSKH